METRYSGTLELPDHEVQTTMINVLSNEWQKGALGDIAKRCKDLRMRRSMAFSHGLKGVKSGLRELISKD